MRYLKKYAPFGFFTSNGAYLIFWGMLKNIVCIANVLFFTYLLQAFDGIVV